MCRGGEVNARCRPIVNAVGARVAEDSDGTPEGPEGKERGEVGERARVGCRECGRLATWRCFV